MTTTVPLRDGNSPHCHRNGSFQNAPWSVSPLMTLLVLLVLLASTPTKNGATTTTSAAFILSSSPSLSHQQRWAFLPVLQRGNQPLFSMISDKKSKDKKQGKQQGPEEEEKSTAGDSYQHDLSAIERLAQEWSAMNRDSSSENHCSTSMGSAGDPYTVQTPSVQPAQDQAAHQMNQLAREWMARNRDEDTIPLPENAMINPPSPKHSRFSVPSHDQTNSFRGQRQPQQQQLQTPQQNSPSMRSASANLKEEAIVIPKHFEATGQMPDVTAEDNAADDNNGKYVFVGKRLDKDPDLRLVMSEAAVWKYFRKEKPSFFSKLPLTLLIERTWDTVEDVLVHLRRIPYEKGWVDLTEQEEETRKTVVVLGSGWAAHALMKVADCNKLRLIIVSPHNHFVFTPMLASAAVGTVEYRSMTEAVRAANPMIADYLEGTATAVNVVEKTVTVQLSPLLEVAMPDGLKGLPGQQGESDSELVTLRYDNLVVAVGSRVDSRGVPGADNCLRLKSTDDAKRLRDAVGQALEYASRPNLTPEERARRVTILIVGGGPTGVELAGELHDLFVDVTRHHKGTYPRLAGVYQVILVHGGADLVPQFSTPLRKEALEALEKKGVQVILNTRVVNVGETSATLSTKVLDPTTGKPTGERNEYTIPIGLPVWCAGTAPVAFVEELLQQLPPEARYKDGRVRVDRWMRPPLYPPHLLGSVLVMGDAAAVEDPDEGGLLPSTAQVAGQQGAFVARLLDRNYDLTTTPPQLYNLLEIDPDDDAAAALARQLGKAGAGTIDDKDNVFYDPTLNVWLRFRGLERAPAFDFLNLGMLAYLGGGEALSQVQVGQAPVLAWAGSAAFVLWRSVYLVKQVATRNRVLVTFDWIKSALFGRDTTRL